MNDDKDLKLSDQLLKELGCYAAIYGCVIAVIKGIELLKNIKKK